MNNCKWCPQACPDSRRRVSFAVTLRSRLPPVAMHFAMKNGQICFSLRKFPAISSAIPKIASDCGCDAVVHLAQDSFPLDPPCDLYDSVLEVSFFWTYVCFSVSSLPTSPVLALVFLCLADLCFVSTLGPNKPSKA